MDLEERVEAGEERAQPRFLNPEEVRMHQATSRAAPTDVAANGALVAIGSTACLSGTQREVEGIAGGGGGRLCGDVHLGSRATEELGGAQVGGWVVRLACFGCGLKRCLRVCR